MMSRPSIVALPEVGSSNVESILARVVFPAPFLPIREKMPFVGMVKLTEDKASLESPYILVSLSQDISLVPKPTLPPDSNLVQLPKERRHGDIIMYGEDLKLHN